MPLDAAFAEQLRAIAPRLHQLMQGFSQVKVLVVGDLAVDEFVTGQVERISREAPVPILRHESTRQIPGGGANAVYNLAKLGAKVKAVGLVGEDEVGRSLRKIFANAGIDTTGILPDPVRPTVTKTRISGHSRQSVTQQMVRIDRKSDLLPAPELQEKLAAVIQQQLSGVDVVVCSDYGDGVFTSPVIAAALQHRCTIVDTQVSLDRYAGAFLFTPNLPEAEKAVGYAISSPALLHQAGQDLLRLTQAQHILITRGEEGMALFERPAQPKDSGYVDCETDDHETDDHETDSGKTGDRKAIPCDTDSQTIPAFNRTDVFDVTGAGDTVVAGITLGLAAGASTWEASVLGNLAASIVVRQFGTATTTVEEMQIALQVLLEQD